jgi:uncharacterized protein with FMN-binding domain
MKRPFPVRLLLFVLLLTGCPGESKAQQADNGSVITTPRLESLGNGTYTGSFRSGLVSATVEITIRDHRITGFVITKHRCGRGRPAEAVAGKVLEQQTLAVDTVSGATASSRVILKAAERALSGAVVTKP